MAGDKYLYQNSGVLTEKAAVQSSAGAGDSGKIPALDSTGRLDSSMMPVGIGSETDVVVASEGLSAGDFVNVYNAAGTLKARKADASTSGKEAHGFVLSAVSQDENATVYRSSQLNNQLTSLTVGAKQFLSASVPGGTSETAPTGTGKVVQVLGIAKSATEILFNPFEPIVLA